MKNLKYVNIACVIIIAGMFFFSCKKATPKAATANVSAVGYWFYYPATPGNNNGGWNGGKLLRSNGTGTTYDFFYNQGSTDTTKAYDGTDTYKTVGDSIFLTTSYPNGQSFQDKGIIDIVSSPNRLVLVTTGIWLKQ